MVEIMIMKKDLSNTISTINIRVCINSVVYCEHGNRPHPILLLIIIKTIPIITAETK